VPSHRDDVSQLLRRRRSPRVTAEPAVSQAPRVPSLPRVAPTVFVARPQRGQATLTPRGQVVPSAGGQSAAVSGDGEPPAPPATRGTGVQRPPTSPYLPEGVVDTRPKGLAVAELQAAVRDAGFEYRPAPGTGEPTVVNGVLDARPVTGAPSLGSVERPDLPPPIHVVDLRDSALAPRYDAAEPVGNVPIDVEAVIETEQVDVRVLSPYPSRSELRRRESAGATGRRGLTGSLSVPQVGIASALGLATIAAPLTGSLIPPAASSTSVTATLDLAGPAQRSSALGQAPFPLVAAAGVNGVEAAAVVGDDSPVASIPAALSAPSRVLVTKVSRSNERAVLPGCDGVLPAAAAAARNGLLPAPELCTLWDGDHKLRNDAAVALARLNVAYQQTFGKPLCLADAYRTLAKQYAVKASRGYLAATPGTSEHGWGRAIDLCGGAAVQNTSTYTWLRANGPRYGWDNPDWARVGGSGPHEAWHFEFFAGGAGGTSATEQEN
jgi:zinc D-Ala-D-Ala carboxypeptidase